MSEGRMHKPVSAKIDEDLRPRWGVGKWLLIAVLTAAGIAAAGLASLCYLDPAHDLFDAAQTGSCWKIRVLLLAHPALVNDRTKGRPPLFAAVRNGHLAAARLLLARGADPNATWLLDRTPLHFAVTNQDLEMVRVLLKHKADPNAVTKDEKRPPLFLAVEAGRDDMARMLLEHGADPKARDHLGRTAMDGALNLYDPDSYPMVRLLVRYKVNGDPWYAGQALDVVAQRGHADLVKPFLSNYGDLNRRSRPYPEWTLLRRAVEQSNRELVELLLAAGADPGRCGFEGRSLIDVARDEDIIELLRKHGTKPK